MTNYFKCPRLILALLFSLRIITTTSAQTDLPDAQIERMLCYKTTTREVQKLSSQVDMEKIAIHELLRTKIITVKKAYQVFLDENEEFIRKMSYEYHQNLFPSWHMAPDQTIMDQYGVKQIFSSTSTVFKGGWFGHDYELKKEGAYVTTDLRYGFPVHTYHTDYTADELREYWETRRTMQEFGVLYPFKYRIPNEKELEEYQNQNFTVIQNSEWIKIFNREVTMTYYLITKQVVFEFYEDYKLIYKIRRFFEWVEEVQQDVLVKEIETTPYVLSTGDCAESETTTVYSDYSLHCEEATDETEIRSKDVDKQENIISISPNPADQFIRINWHGNLNETDVFDVMIYNQLGSLVFQTTTKGKLPDLVNIQTFQSGVYHVSIQVNQDFYSTTFVKN